MYATRAHSHVRTESGCVGRGTCPAAHGVALVRAGGEDQRMLGSEGGGQCVPGSRLRLFLKAVQCQDKLEAGEKQVFNHRCPTGREPDKTGQTDKS